MKYKSTITRISIHPENENPIFKEGAINVSIQDEGAGPFLTLSQTWPENVESVRIDLDELELITAEAKKLIGQFPKEKKV